VSMAVLELYAALGRDTVCTGVCNPVIAIYFPGRTLTSRSSDDESASAVPPARGERQDPGDRPGKDRAAGSDPRHGLDLGGRAQTAHVVPARVDAGGRSQPAALEARCPGRARREGRGRDDALSHGTQARDSLPRHRAAGPAAYGR